MTLNNLPTIKLPKGGVFLTAASLAFFIFFFTRPKEGDTEEQ